MNPFETLANSCAVSYRQTIDPAELRDAFLTGTVGTKLIPYLTVALNESPIEMLFAAVLACEEGRQREVFENLRKLAREVGAEERIEAWLNG